MTVATAEIQATINGKQLNLPSGMTIIELLARLEIQTTHVAVEHNREIVPKAAYDSRRIANGDSLEIVHFVGGG